MATLGLSQGYWQNSLIEEARKTFMITMLTGLLTFMRIPQGGLDAVADFQSMVQHELAKLNGML